MCRSNSQMREKIKKKERKDKDGIIKEIENMRENQKMGEERLHTGGKWKQIQPMEKRE